MELNISIATVFFQYTNFKDDLIEYKCLSCNKSQRNFDEKLKERFLIPANFLAMITIS